MAIMQKFLLVLMSCSFRCPSACRIPGGGRLFTAQLALSIDGAIDRRDSSTSWLTES
jgi:hypothetical protein